MKMFHKLEEEGVSDVSSRNVGFYVPRSRAFIYIVLFTCVFLILVILAIFVALGKPHNNQHSQSAGTEQPLVVTGGPTKAPAPTTAGQQPYWNVRLPSNIIPNHYELTLNIDLKDLKFSGNVDIHVDVIEPTEWVLVHVNLLKLTSAEVYRKDSNEALATEEKFEFKKNQFYVFRMKNELSKGKYVIKMEFNAPLTDDLAGLYRSTYKHKDGTSVTIAVTQFQPTDARRTFPCFDEPALKATFKVFIIHDPQFNAVSNMPIVNSEINEKGLTKDEFNISRIMPTYLLAFVVTDFGYKENKTATGISMKVYAPKDQIDQVDYALKIGVSILEYYEKYFNIPYPLPKADMIAIPDFSAGAMENWGLITYRESYLLYDPNQSSESVKQRVALVIAHELAHQWFGNLVTMEWWNDLWLNEGFASFVEAVGMDSCHPDWKMHDQFVISDISTAFKLDSRMSSHPISVPVNHPDEINEIFDSISYNKGAALIRMLQDIIGKDTFNEGLTKYLLKHQYGNAETSDLWESLSKVATEKGKPVNVAEVMDTWTLQMGFPVLNVKSIGNGKVRIIQERFLQDPNANVSDTKYTSNYGYKWNIMFQYAVCNKNVSTKGNEISNKIWLNLTDDNVEITMDSSKWIKGNLGQNGYFRVNYDEKNWKDLANQLLTYHQALESADRAGMINDAFSLARAQLMDYSLALDLTKYMSNELEYVPFSASMSGLDYILGVVSRTKPTYKNMQKYMKKQCMKRYESLGFEHQVGDSHLNTFLRNSVRSTMCDMGYQSCLDNCTKLFKDWKENGTQVPANARSLVYYYGIAQGSVEEWDWLFEKFQNTTVASERKTILYALAGTREPWLLNRYLEYSLDSSYIKSQDTRTVIGYVANYNPMGRYMAWNFIRYNWETISEKFGQGFQFTIRSLLLSVTSSFNTKFELKEVEKFFNDKGLSSQNDRRALEEIRSNISWLKNYEQLVGDWLEEWLKNN